MQTLGGRGGGTRLNDAVYVWKNVHEMVIAEIGRQILNLFRKRILCSFLD